MAKDCARALGLGLLLALMAQLPGQLAAMDLRQASQRPLLSEVVQGAD